MNNQAKVKCPRCGSVNVIIQNRGYSFLQGFACGVGLVIVDFFYTAISQGEDFQALDEYGQFGFAGGLLLKLVFVFIFGMLLGLIGKNKLVARCLKCKNRFDPSIGIIEETIQEPVVDHRGKGDLDPTKSDVREFQERIRGYKKTHKVVDQQWLEGLIEEYNEKFNEDFHQYL